jgi:hypothetical protein
MINTKREKTAYKIRKQAINLNMVILIFQKQIAESIQSYKMAN